MSHYSNAFKTPRLLKWADRMAASLAKLYEKRESRPIFTYSGMSGIATATALSLAIARSNNPFCYGMMYVRKEYEQCHGSPIEYDFNFDEYYIGSNGDFVFVDDFIRSGTTLLCCAIGFQQQTRTSLKLSPTTKVLLSGSCGEDGDFEPRELMKGDFLTNRLSLGIAEINKQLEQAFLRSKPCGMPTLAAFARKTPSRAPTPSPDHVW